MTFLDRLAPAGRTCLRLANRSGLRRSATEREQAEPVI